MKPRTSEGVIPKLPPSHSWTGCSRPGQREEPQHPNPGGSRGLSGIPAGFLSFLTRTFTTQTKQRGQGGVPTLPTIPFCWFCDKGCQGLASGGLVGWHWGHSAFPPGAPPSTAHGAAELWAPHTPEDPQSPPNHPPHHQTNPTSGHTRGFLRFRVSSTGFALMIPKIHFPTAAGLELPVPEQIPNSPTKPPRPPRDFLWEAFQWRKHKFMGES